MAPRRHRPLLNRIFHHSNGLSAKETCLGTGHPDDWHGAAYHILNIVRIKDFSRSALISRMKWLQWQNLARNVMFLCVCTLMFSCCGNVEFMQL
uniref:Uncharacterized protein n=1 Tax=Arundo donax TaxID=35708 RepID=A0A0A8XQ15_ARUDO